MLMVFVDFNNNLFQKLQQYFSQKIDSKKFFLILVYLGWIAA